MNGRRSNIEIIADILRMGQASKTQIMYRVSMSYAQLQKYLDYLIDRGFLSRDASEYRGGLYCVTQEGKSLLESIEKIEELLAVNNNGAEMTENISQAMVPPRDSNRVVSRLSKHGNRVAI